MTIDLVNFTPLTALIGGGMIGLAALALMAVKGRVMGISGILGSLIRPDVETGNLNFTSGGILKDKFPSEHLVFLLAMLVFGIGKAAIMPIHRWLPA